MMTEGSVISARPAPGAYLCDVDDIPEPGAKGFRFEKGEARWLGFVVRAEGRVVGYENSCAHVGWPLSAMDDRFLTRDGRHIICNIHGALFQIENGLCVAGPCHGLSLDPWPIEVREGKVLVAAPGA